MGWSGQEGSVEGPNKRGRPLGRWKDKVEEYLGKDKKLYAAFMDLEKAYDRVDREALWSVLKIYGVGGMGERKHPEMVWPY